MCCDGLLDSLINIAAKVEFDYGGIIEILHSVSLLWASAPVAWLHT